VFATARRGKDDTARILARAVVLRERPDRRSVRHVEGASRLPKGGTWMFLEIDAATHTQVDTSAR